MLGLFQAVSTIGSSVSFHYDTFMLCVNSSSFIFQLRVISSLCTRSDWPLMRSQLTHSYLLQGVKVSLSSASVSSFPSIDSVILQLMWTLEELQQQISVIDKQYKRCKFWL